MRWQAWQDEYRSCVDVGILLPYLCSLHKLKSKNEILICTFFFRIPVRLVFFIQFHFFRSLSVLLQL